MKQVGVGRQVVVVEGRLCARKVSTLSRVLS